MPEPKKRRRPAKSCEQCRSRKVKCDLEQPCGPCTRTRAGVACVYSEATVRTSPTPHAPLSARNTESDQIPSQGTQESNHFDHSLADNGRQQSASLIDEHAASNSTITYVSQSDVNNGQTTQPSNTLGRTPNPKSTRWDSDMLESDREKTKANTVFPKDNPSNLSTELPRPHLRLAAEKTKLFGPSHWSHTARKFQDLGQIDYRDADNSKDQYGNDFFELVSECRKLRQTIKRRQSVTLNDSVPNLTSTFPSRETCDQLLDAYLRTFEGMYRIVYVPIFQEEYSQFWQNHQSITTATSMKLALVFAIGTTFYPTMVEHERLHRLARTWIYTAQSWLTGTAEKSTMNLDGVQVACLLQLARQVTALGTTSWSSTDLPLYLAMSIGLHRDPRYFPSLSPFQALMRRRLWYTTMELAVQSALASSVPLTISTDHYDTDPPANVDDQTIQPETQDYFSEIPPTNVSDSSLQRLLLQSLPLRLRVAATLSSLSHQYSYEYAIETGNALKTASREIMTFISSAQSRPRTGSLNFSLFHAHFLDIYLRRNILLLHKAFVIQSRTDPRFYYSRKVCLETTMVIASYAYNLTLPAEDLDDLSRLLMVIRGPLNGPLSLEVITMLGLELVTQLEEAGSGPSTTVDPAEKLARANRAPILGVLEHIRRQLLQIIAFGSPSLKRYGYVSAMLAQIYAMEKGQSSFQAVRASVKESMATVLPLLEATMAASSPRDSVATLTNPEMASDPVPTATGSFDFDESLDLNDLFYVPDMNFANMLDW
ncbi:hypothetical protein ACLMJK_009439 [Lecanora helva]